MLKLTNSPSKKKKTQQQKQQKTSKQTKKEIKNKAPTRGQPFYGYSEKPPDSSRLFPVALGYGGHILVLNPESQRGVGVGGLNK